IVAAHDAPLKPVENFQALPGLGARGQVDGHDSIIGRAGLFGDVPPDLSAWCQAQEQTGHTTVLVTVDAQMSGALALTDTLKPSAPAAIAQLKALGLRPILLTGDNESTARAVAEAAGIGEVIAGALPETKAQLIADLKAA